MKAFLKDLNPYEVFVSVFGFGIVVMVFAVCLKISIGQTPDPTWGIWGVFVAVVCWSALMGEIVWKRVKRWKVQQETLIRRHEQVMAKARVYQWGRDYLPRWDHISTHHEGCYERHSECAVHIAGDAAANYKDDDEL